MAEVNTAIDCARTALRKGAKSVKLLYRRTREEMPAESYEVEEALHEGVEMIFLTAPSKIVSQNGKKMLHCIKMTLGEPDRSGRRRPVPIDGSEEVIEADTIIGAIGQSTNTQFLYNDLPVKLNKWGDIEINGRSFQTSEMNIFAGGDCVTGPATVIQAVAAGRHAAEAMDSFMMKGYVKEHNVDYSCSRGTMEDLPKWEFEEILNYHVQVCLRLQWIHVKTILMKLNWVMMSTRQEKKRVVASDAAALSATAVI